MKSLSTILFLCLLLPAMLPAQERPMRRQGGLNPFEPTVTQAEADLLRTATGLFTTNTVAAVALLKGAQSEAGSAAIDFALGNFLYQTEALEDAAAAYRAAIDKLPLFRSAINNLGRVYMLQDDLEHAVRTFQRLVRDGQADADMLVLLGHALLQLGKPVSAESAYRQSLVLEADAPVAMRGLVKCLIDQARTREALAMTRELLKQHPKDGELWALRANAHVLLDQPDAAITSIETARRLDLADADLLAGLGDLYVNRDQPRDAMEAYRQAFGGQSPSPERMLRAARGFLMMGAFDEAETLLADIETLAEKPAPREPQRHEVVRLRGHLAHARGDIDTARTQFRLLAREDPLDGDALLALADMSAADGDAQAAELLYERAARIEGFEARARVRHAELAVRNRQYAEAVTLLEAAQVYDPLPYVDRYLEQIRRLAARP